jgi:hypothetical protein
LIRLFKHRHEVSAPTWYHMIVSISINTGTYLKKAGRNYKSLDDELPVANFPT